MKISNQIIISVFFLGFLAILNLAQESKSDFSTYTFDTTGVTVDSIDIVRANGSKERQVYLYDLPNGKFTELYKIWNSTDWINDWRHVYYYGVDNKITSRCGDNWSDSSWIPSWCYQYEYDENVNLISETLENINSATGNWVYIKRSLNSYNSANQKIGRLDQQWNGTKWTNKWQAEYGYDEYGNRNYIVSGDFASDLWIKERRTNFTYNESGDRLLYQVETIDESNQWEFDLRIVRTFDINSNILSEARDVWSNEQWENDYFILYNYNEFNYLNRETFGQNTDSTFNSIYRISYEYNASGKKMVDLFEQWDINEWNINFRANYEYDANGNLVFKLNENYFNGYWEPFYREFFEYQENKLVKSVYENYSEGSWVMRDGFYDFYGFPGLNFYIRGAIISFYHNNVTNIISTNNIMNSYFLSQNYPNPFNPSTKIKYSIPTSGQTEISLFDLLGRKVRTLVNENKNAGEYEIDFIADNLSNGIYFYRIISGNYSETKKMILIK